MAGVKTMMNMSEDNSNQQHPRRCPFGQQKQQATEQAVNSGCSKSNGSTGWFSGAAFDGLHTSPHFDGRYGQATEATSFWGP